MKRGREGGRDEERGREEESKEEEQGERERKRGRGKEDGRQIKQVWQNIDDFFKLGFGTRGVHFAISSTVGIFKIFMVKTLHTHIYMHI